MGLFLHDSKDFTSLQTVYKIVCVPSHGQCSAERDFTVYNELLVKNLRKVFLRWQFQGYDYFQSFGIKVHGYTIPTDVIKSCKCAHGRYQATLEDNRALHP